MLVACSSTLNADLYTALNGDSFAYIIQVFFAKQGNTNSRAQIAVGYHNGRMATRIYNANTSTWSEWRKKADANEYLPLIGGTLTGNLIVKKDSVPTVEMLSTAQGKADFVKNANLTVDYGAQIIDRDASDNQAILQLRASQWDNPANALILQLRNTDSSTSNGYQVYHTGNKPTATDIGAYDLTSVATSIASGTDLNDLTTAGTYKCSSVATAESLLNCPTVTAFKLVVDILGSVVRQTITLENNSSYLPIWRTKSSTGTWGAWLTAFITKGGTLTGNVRIEGPTYPQFAMKDVTYGTLGLVQHVNGTSMLQTINVSGDDSNARDLRLYTSSMFGSVADALKLLDTVDNTRTFYNIYGEHNITAGTTDLTAGTSALATGCIYQVYE